MYMRKMALGCLAGIVIAAGCKKDNKTQGVENGEGCVVQNSVGTGSIIEGQYIVIYNSTDNADSVTLTSINDRVSRVLKNNNISEKVIERSFSGNPGGFVAKLSVAEAEKLRRDVSVKAIENDRIISLGTCFTVAAPTLITWNVKKVGYGDGTGKTVWIIDSGVDTDHPDLNVDISRSRSFLKGQTSFEDENGHGTHVAGIIGAKNNLFGVLGVASGANVVALRVLDKDGEGTLSGIVQALSYINSNAKAGDVVNMSLGEEEPSDLLDQQVQNTASKGILISIAAGNDNKPAINFSPGRANGANIFTVSAVDSLNTFASFSNYGNDAVDYAAPGVAIVSTWLDGKYARVSGTSMAAPHVAGLLLLNGRNLKTSASALNDPDGNPDPIAHK